MAKKVGKIKRGELTIASEINERMPTVTNGLVAHYPLDGVADCIVCHREYINRTVNGFEQVPIIYSANQPFIFSCKFKVGWDGADDKYLISLQNGNIDGNTFNFGIQTNVLLQYPSLTYSGTLDFQNKICQLLLDYNGTTLAVYLNGEYLSSRSLSIAACTYLRIGEYHNSATADSWIGELWDWEFTLKNAMTISNASFTPNGLDIDEATTNLVNTNQGALGVNLGTSPWGGIRVDSNTMVEDTTPFGVRDVVEVKWHTVSNDGGMATCNAGWFAVSPNTTYTASMYYKFGPENPQSVSTVNWLYPRQYVSIGGAQVSEFGWASDSRKIDCGNGWWRIWGTFTTTATTNAIYFDNYTYDTAVGKNYWLRMFGAQFEQKNFMTAFTQGSRALGTVSIPNPVTTGDFTINFKCRNKRPINDPFGYATIMTMGDYYTNNSFTIMDYGNSSVSGSQMLIRKGNAGEWAWGNGSFTDTNTFNKEVTYTVVKNSTDYVCYSNGVLIGTINHLSTTMQSLVWLGGRTSSGNIANSTFRDLSIFNRALSAAEIKTLVKNNLHITAIGDLTSTSVQERTNGYNPTARYFPLDVNGKDEYNQISPGTETNIVYDGAAYVGNGTTNLVYDSGVINWSTGSLGAAYTQTELVPNDRYKFVSTTAGGIRFFIPLAKLTNGQPYNMSFRYKITSGPSTANFYMTDWCDTTLISDTTTDYGGFKYKSAYGTRATYDGTYRFMDLWITANTEVEVWNIQVENRTFATPFTNGVRGNSVLTYPTSGLLSGTDNTILVSYKPFTNLNNTVLSNANVNYWWGLYQGGTNKLYMHEGSTGASNVPNTFSADIAKWNQVAIKWNATTQYFYGNGQLLGSLPTTGLTNTANIPNLYLGYGWNLGDAYFRDLIIDKRMWSDLEIANAYKTMVRKKMDNLIVQNEIIEGVVL